MQLPQGGGPYLGRALLLAIIVVFVCVLVWLDQELPVVVMTLGGVSAAVIAVSTGRQPREAG